MIIEIEKKYDMTDTDYEKIKENCEFISKKIVLDKFFDTSDFQLFSQRIKLRERNGELQLKTKISSNTDAYSKSTEITHLQEVQEALLDLGVDYKNTQQVLEISTEVEKYQLLFRGYNFTIDIQKYKYDYRYEVELELEEDLEIDPAQLISDFRTSIHLISDEQIVNGSKVTLCAKNENPALYQVIMKTKTV